jgi:hypothetical protein
MASRRGSSSLAGQLPGRFAWRQWTHTFIRAKAGTTTVMVRARNNAGCHPSGQAPVQQRQLSQHHRPEAVAAGDVDYPNSVRAMKDGYLNLALDEQPYLQGYLPILNICLTKKFGFSGLNVDTAGAFIDSATVDSVAPLVEKGIR